MPIETPKDYYRASGFWVVSDITMPQESVLPHAQTPGAWVKRLFENKFFCDRPIQGWKLHVCVEPMQAEPLFDLLSPLLIRFGIFHKFLPFETAWNQDTSKERSQQLSRRNNQGEGKNLTIYPKDPLHLNAIVQLIEREVRRYRAETAADHASQGRPAPAVLRPYPGGTKGNLPIGQTHLVSTRYGCFSGKRIYNPFNDSYVGDPRYGQPSPSFASNIPSEIRTLM